MTTSTPPMSRATSGSGSARASIIKDESGSVVCARSYTALPALHIIPLLKAASFEIATTETDAGCVAAKSVSTYPEILPKATGKIVRHGDPNADSFFAALYDNRAVLAIADGCNWGLRSYNASRAALEGVSQYLVSHEDQMTDLRNAGRLLLRALCEANRKIMTSATCVHDVGTTTVLAGIVMQVKNEEEDRTEWGFLCASVGDCKALLWNKHTGAFTDVTTGNRSTDVRDPGGRLGPYIGSDPDLRNLRLFYRVVQPGDIIALCTDGVYDNFDPQFLGKSPKEFGFSQPDWPSVPVPAYEQKKEEFALAFAKGLVKEKVGDRPTPASLVGCFVGHAQELTRKAREWMEANPGARQPDDYTRYPGKMDHTTTLAFAVGQPLPENPAPSQAAPSASPVLPKSP